MEHIEIDTSLGWYNYNIDYMILDIKNFKNKFLNKKIISNIDIFWFIYIHSPHREKVDTLHNNLFKHIQFYENYNKNNTILIDEIIELKDSLGSIVFRKNTEIFFNPVIISTIFNKLIDLIYKIVEEDLPDIDTYKLKWESKFTFDIKPETFILDDLSNEEIKEILKKYKPILASLEKYHTYIIYYINNMILPLLMDLEDYLDTFKH